MVSTNYMTMASALCLFPFPSVVPILALHNYVCLKWDILRLSVLLICFVTICHVKRWEVNLENSVLRVVALVDANVGRLWSEFDTL
jgi:hypothetical protein